LEARSGSVDQLNETASTKASPVYAPSACA
jgi:hypothetical protein